MKKSTLHPKTLSMGIAIVGIVSQAAIAAPVSINMSQIDGDKADDTFSIGVTRSTTSRPYEGIGDQSATLPYFSARSGDFYIEGLDIGYKLSSKNKLRWDLVAVPRFLGYEENDSPNLNGLDETHYSYHGGLSVNWDSGFGNLNVQALTDLLNESGGSEIIGTLSHSYTLGDLSLTPAISINWQDSELTDHYYGVKASQATINRPAYDGGNSLNTAISLTVNYELNKHFSLIGQVRADQYGSEIEDSPLVDSDNTTSTTLGLVYSF